MLENRRTVLILVLVARPLSEKWVDDENNKGTCGYFHLPALELFSKKTFFIIDTPFEKNRERETVREPDCQS